MGELLKTGQKVKYHDAIFTLILDENPDEGVIHIRHDGRGYVATDVLTSQVEVQNN